MSNNVSNFATRVSTADGAFADPYDHEISLIDATEAADPPEQDAPQPSSASAQSSRLSKIPTKALVKDQLVKRKYAKWQADRVATQSSVDEPQPQGSRPASEPVEEGEHAQPTQTVDFAHDGSVNRGQKSVEKRRLESKRLKHQVHEIDILYENQRGSFFCGIPLYSHSSLLPVDPGPWVNKDFHDSPVNITNAQVPDPSWEWAWKTWRRRWLRKRVKRDDGRLRVRPGSLGAAHHLTGDYFTIHSKRDRSPASVVEGTAQTARPASFLSYQSTTASELPPEDVKDIASLLKALKLAAVDREKIDLVKHFVNQAGDELYYLGEHIPDIMSFLVFQNSRTQLLAHLKKTTDHARRHRQKHEDEKRPESDEESRRIDNLVKAVDAANAQIGGLEFWSDRKHVLKMSDDNALETRAIATIFDAPAPKPKVEEDPVKEIRGIPASADLNGQRTASAEAKDEDKDEKEEEKKKKQDKGKGRARDHDSEDDQVEADSSSTPTPRLRPDQVLIPDSD
ncbi:hypothetical protein LTS17_000488 [Exophiala oligosperma]